MNIRGAIFRLFLAPVALISIVNGYSAFTKTLEISEIEAKIRDIRVNTKPRFDAGKAYAEHKGPWDRYQFAEYEALNDLSYAKISRKDSLLYFWATLPLYLFVWTAIHWICTGSIKGALSGVIPSSRKES